MDVKKKIFIGSSSEGRGILDKVEALLIDEYDIIRWDKAMTLNKSTLDCLIEQAIKVDEAIFIGTADNKSEAIDNNRHNIEGVQIKHRDNVVFEFGLFLGMLGRHDCVYLVEDTTLATMMSDYKGITVVPFKNNNDSSLSDAIENIKNHFNQYSRRDVNLFPSSAFATAYFENFIKPIFAHYNINNGYIVDNKKKKYKNCSIKIILPITITTDVNCQFMDIRRMKNISTQTIQIQCLGRDRTIVVDVNTKNNELKIIDFPTIIGGIYSTVQTLLPKESDKIAPDYDAIMKREIERFKEMLLMYIGEYPCRSIDVKIINENELEVETPQQKTKLRYSFLKNKRS